MCWAFCISIKWYIYYRSRVRNLRDDSAYIAVARENHSRWSFLTFCLVVIVVRVVCSQQPASGGGGCGTAERTQHNTIASADLGWVLVGNLECIDLVPLRFQYRAQIYLLAKHNDLDIFFSLYNQKHAFYQWPKLSKTLKACFENGLFWFVYSPVANCRSVNNRRGYGQF